jgi:hypothetical protein
VSFARPFPFFLILLPYSLGKNEGVFEYQNFTNTVA